MNTQPNIELNEQQDPHDEHGYHPYVRRLIGVALAVLILLTLLTAMLLAIRLAEYIKIDEREVLLQSNMNQGLDLFSITYQNDSGEITVHGLDEQKVVAPGTSVEYTIRLRNKDKVALDYSLIPDVTYTSEYAVPVVFRMLNDNGEYVIGSAKSWLTAEEIGQLSEQDTLLRNESTEYVFQWKWDFEGDDAYDTLLGNESTRENVGLSVSFTLLAEANTTLDVNGGLRGSGLGDILFNALALLLLLIAIALLIWAFSKRKKKPGEQDADEQAQEAAPVQE